MIVTIRGEEKLSEEDSTLLVFCYGSDLVSKRIAEHAPSAEKVCVAALPRHRLAFHKLGRDGSGKATFVETGDEADVVYGVVVRVDDSELPTLHAQQGLGEGCMFERIEVLRGGCDLRAFAYQATESHIDESLQPFDWYRSLVVAGAREHELPELYIESLEAVPAVEDSDVARARRNLEYLDSSLTT